MELNVPQPESFLFPLLSYYELFVTYSHDLITKNIAPLTSFPIAFFRSSCLLSKILKTPKGRQAQCRVFESLYLFHL